MSHAGIWLGRRWTIRARSQIRTRRSYAKIEAWRNGRIKGEHAYLLLYLAGIAMKRGRGEFATYLC